MICALSKRYSVDLSDLTSERPDKNRFTNWQQVSQLENVSKLDAHNHVAANLRHQYCSLLLPYNTLTLTSAFLTDIIRTGCHGQQQPVAKR